MDDILVILVATEKWHLLLLFTTDNITSIFIGPASLIWHPRRTPSHHHATVSLLLLLLPLLLLRTYVRTTRCTPYLKLAGRFSKKAFMPSF